MATNKIVLREVEEVMADYVPLYQPIYPLFFAKAAQYATEVGTNDFRRVDTIGDIRARQITPKDTELKQIAVAESKKKYYKYFLANQFQISNLQDRQGIEDVQAQVLDEHQLHQDELFLMGEGTTPGTQLNNGLYLSSDPNYTLLDSTELSATDRLYVLHRAIMETASRADNVGGRKLVILYGSGITSLYDSLFPTSARSFRSALEESLGDNYSTIKLPSRATPAGAMGWMIANLDQVKTHWTLLPQIHDQGINAEKMYAWTNFLQGSMMLEVLAKDGVIRQPATLAS